MSTTHSAGEQQRNIISQAQSLYSFVRDVSQATSCALSTQHPTHTLILDLLPQDALNVHLSSPGEPFTLTVRKPFLQSPPAPPQSVQPWLSVPEAPYGEGHVQDTLFSADHALFESFTDDPQRVQDYRTWKKAYTRWSVQSATTKKTLQLFYELYATYQELARSGDSVELTLADGFIRDASAPQNILGPLVTHRVHISHNIQENTLRITDAYARTRFHSLSCIPESVRQWAVRLFTSAEYREQQVTWDSMQLAAFFTEFTRRFTAHTSSETKRRSPSPHAAAPQYTVYHKPQLILRARTDASGYAASQILSQMEQTASLAPPLRALTEEESIRVLKSPTAKDVLHSMKESALTVIPYSSAQEHAPEDLLAQVARLVLSSGKTLALTAAHQKSLTRVFSHIPKEFQEFFATSSFSPEAPSYTAAQERLKALSQAHTLRELKDEITRMQDDESHLLALLGKPDARLTEPSIVYQNERIPVRIAEDFLSSHAHLAGYFPGPVQVDAPLPLTMPELHDLYAINERLSGDVLAELRAQLPELNTLSPVREFSQQCSALHHAEKLLAHTYEAHPWVRRSTWSPESSSAECCDAVRDMLSHAETLFTLHEESWTVPCLLAGSDLHQRSAWEALADALEDAAELYGSSQQVFTWTDIRRAGGERTVDERAFHALDTLEDYMRAHHTLTRFSLLTHPTVRTAQQILSPFIHAEKVHTPADLERIRMQLRKRSALQRIFATARAVGVEEGFSSADGRYPTAQDIHKLLQWHTATFLPALQCLHITEDEILRILGDSDGAKEKENWTAETLSRCVMDILPVLCDVVELTDSARRAQSALAKTRAVCEGAAQRGSAACSSILDACRKADDALYASAYARLASISAQSQLYERREKYREKIHAVCPGWADALDAHEGMHRFADVPAHLNAAWTYAQYASILAQQKQDGADHNPTPPYRTEVSEKNTKDALMRLRSVREKLSLLSAQYHALHRMQRQTGAAPPAASAHQSTQQSVLSAHIPAWVLPAWSVYEQLPAKPALDVLVIADAHLLDVRALSLLSYASTVIVCGRPDMMGVRGGILACSPALRDAVEQYSMQYLQPLQSSQHPQTYSADDSLLDVVLQKAAWTSPQVEEPALSQLTTRISRIPSLAAYRVPHMSTEVDTLVALIQACMNRHGYARKTFGVVSLGDDAYTLQLSAALSTELGPAPCTERHILCGPPSSFQSVERDVLFLSCAQNARSVRRMPKRGERAERQLSALVSSAKEELWVVHDFDPDKDLDRDDVRTELFAHLSPESALSSAVRAGVSELLGRKMRVQNGAQDKDSKLITDLAASLGLTLQPRESA